MVLPSFTFSINRMAVLRTHQPLLQFDFIFKLSKIGKKFNEYLEILQSLTKRVIQERKEASRLNNLEGKEMFSNEDVLLGKKKRLAFLDLLIAASENGKLLSDNDIQEEVNTFLFEVKREQFFLTTKSTYFAFYRDMILQLLASAGAFLC